METQKHKNNITFLHIRCKACNKELDGSFYDPRYCKECYSAGEDNTNDEDIGEIDEVVA